MDIDIGKTLEKEQQEKEQKELKEAILKEQLSNQESEDKGRRDARNIAILVVVILGVLAFSLGGFKMMGNITGAQVYSVNELHQLNEEGKLDESRGYMYNGFSIVLNEGSWYTQVNRFGTIVVIPLRHHPKEVEDVLIYGQLDESFNKGEEVFIAIDPKVSGNKYYSLAIGELSSNLAKGIGRQPVGSCIEDHEACEGRPIVNCLSTEGKPMVQLLASKNNQTEVEYAGTCIKITGDGEDLVKAIDRVLYHWYGIMD